MSVNAKKCVYLHRVSYGETDAMGVLYYAEYMHVFERARSQYIRELGMSYAEVERRGIYLPVREAACRYRSSARYDELMAVQVTVEELRGASMTFVYEMTNKETGQLVATGMTQHALVDGTGKPVRMPEWFKLLVLGGTE